VVRSQRQCGLARYDRGLPIDALLIDFEELDAIEQTRKVCLKTVETLGRLNTAQVSLHSVCANCAARPVFRKKN
jgi:hypothetical protein